MTVDGVARLLPIVVRHSLSQPHRMGRLVRRIQAGPGDLPEQLRTWLDSLGYAEGEQPETVADAPELEELGAGSCKDYAAAACAVGLAAGRRARLVVVGAPGGAWAPHVWAQVQGRDGRWACVDPTPGAPPFGVSPATVLPPRAPLYLVEVTRGR